MKMYFCHFLKRLEIHSAGLYCESLLQHGNRYCLLAVCLYRVRLYFQFRFSAKFPRIEREANFPLFPKVIFPKNREEENSAASCFDFENLLRETADRCVQYRSFNDKKKKRKKKKRSERKLAGILIQFLVFLVRYSSS